MIEADQLIPVGIDSWALRQLHSHLIMRALRSTMEGSSTEPPAASSLPPAHWLAAQSEDESTELESEKNTGDDVCELTLLIKLQQNIVTLLS